MNISYKKLLWIISICTILIFKTIIIASPSAKVSSGYFYSKSYEGYAGYCAVITPELEEVSNSMSNVLKIRNFKLKNSQESHRYISKKKPKKIISKSKHKTFSQIAIKNTSQPTSIPIKDNPFEKLYTYIHTK